MPWAIPAPHTQLSLGSFPSCLASQVPWGGSPFCSLLQTYPQTEGGPFSFIVLGLVISGALLGAGFTEGTVYILDAMSLENETSEPFKYSKSSVTHVSFSHDSNYMATAVSSSLCSVLFSAGKGSRSLGKVGRKGKGWRG